MTILSVEEFMRLRYSEVPADYERAAREDVPMEVWREIINRHPETRVWVAHNKTVPLEILAILVSDREVAVRHAVAMKRKLTPDLLDRLAQDSDESIRMRVAMHRSVSRETLEGLRDDSWDRVREIARERLSRLG